MVKVIIEVVISSLEEAADMELEIGTVFVVLLGWVCDIDEVTVTLLEALVSVFVTVTFSQDLEYLDEVR